VCKRILLGISELPNLRSEVFDILNVIIQCHGISLKRLARRCESLGITYERAEPHCKKCKALEKSVAGPASRLGGRREQTKPTTRSENKAQQGYTGRPVAKLAAVETCIYADRCDQTERLSLRERE